MAKKDEKTALQKGDPRQKTLKGMLAAATPSLREVMPKYLDADRMVRIAMAATSRSHGLLACTPMSILGAVMQSAQLGLEIGGVNGHAYMVPFKNKHTGRTEAQLIPGYKGFIQLVWRGAKIDVSADVVYDRDSFAFQKGTDPYLRHVPELDRRGSVIAAYATARFPDGRVKFEVMSFAALEVIRKRAASSRSDSPWNTDWDEMAKKTVIKRIIKTLPVTDDQLHKAAEIDARADLGQATAFHDVIDVPADDGSGDEPTAPNGKSGGRIQEIRDQGEPAAEAAGNAPPAPANGRSAPIGDAEKEQILADERSSQEKQVAAAAEIASTSRKAGF